MKIKPCPFCGLTGAIELDYIEHHWSGEQDVKYAGKVSCELCGVSIFSNGFHDSAESAYYSAVAKWNRRADNASY